MLEKPLKPRLSFNWNTIISLSVYFSLFVIETGVASERPPVPSSKALESQAAQIGNITYKIADVFDLSDPKEDNFAFKFLNFFHFKTRQFVLENQLLFKSGDPYSAQLIEETERNIRSNRYIYDAWITPIRYQDGKVDIQIKTQDTWSLSFGFSFDNAGGESDTSLFIEERNLLGLGTRLTLVKSSDIDRTENRVSYRDNNIAGKYIAFGFDYSNNSDGYFRALEVQRPFYAFNVTDAYGFKINSEQLTEKLYLDGIIIDQYQHGISNASIFYGFSKGLVRNRTLRWNIGTSYSENQFNELSNGETNNPLPSDNKTVALSIGANYIQNRYIKTKNFEHIMRTEDVNIGRDFSGSVGLASTAWGSDNNAIILSAAMNNAYRVNADQLFLWTLSGSGRGVSDGFENISAYASSLYHAPNFTNQAFHAKFNFQLAHNPDDNNQLLMGGDNGLPGYPLRVQSGNRSMLFNIEQRYYTNWHLLQLVRVGGTLFFNSGSAWIPGSDIQQFKLMSDVGLGIRLESSRSESGRTLHMNLAFPLNSERASDRWLFTVATRGKF